MKIFLDDERETPKGWDRTYTVDDTIRLLNTRQVKSLSLDNDLGLGQKEGWLVLQWLEEKIVDDPSFVPPIVQIHSANTVRKQHMERILGSIRRIRQQQLEEQKED